MNRLVETVLVGDQWRTFCRSDHECFVDALESALADLQYAYERNATETSNAERTVYGSDDTATKVRVSSPVEFQIRVLPVTADPLTRAALSFLARSDDREEMTGGVCLVDAKPISDETKPAVGRVLTAVADRLEHRPWKLANHPRFRFAVLQRYKIRAKWRYWSRTGVDPSDTAVGDGAGRD